MKDAHPRLGKYLFTNNLNQVRWLYTLTYSTAAVVSNAPEVAAQAIFLFRRDQLLDLERRRVPLCVCGICPFNRALSVFVDHVLSRCEFLSRTGRNEFYQELRRFVCAGVGAAPTLTPCSFALTATIAQGAEPGLEVHVCGSIGKSQPLLFAIVQYMCLTCPAPCRSGARPSSRCCSAACAGSCPRTASRCA